MSKPAGGSAPSVERALDILEIVASARNGLTLSELARRLDLPKSSVYYVLRAMQRKGYLRRSALTNRFVFGLKIFTLAHMALSRIEIRQLAAPYLWSLMEKSRLMVHLAILEHDEALIITKLEPPGSTPLATWAGKRMDLHCSGVGKAILAFLSDEQVRLLCLKGFTRYNDNTITSPRKVKEEVARIRKLGYAFEDEEGELGWRCVGAPVLDSAGNVTAAVSVAGTTEQITRENLSVLIHAVKDTADAISRCLAMSHQTGRG